MKRVGIKILAFTIALFCFQLSVSAQNLSVFGVKPDGQFAYKKADFSNQIFALQDYYYGAIAFSQSTGATGGAWDYYSENDAARAAVNSCGQSDCRAVYIFWNTCGALAVGDGNGWGTGSSPNLYTAQAYARSSCENAGNSNCRNYYWVCTTRY